MPAGRRRGRETADCLSFARAARNGLAILPALIALAAPAHAQTTLNWDPNGATAGIGGAGTWDTTSNFWTPNSDGTTGPYGPWVNGDNTAVFRGGTTYTVTLAEPITAGDLNTVAANVILTGSTLTLAGTPTINLSGGFIQFNSALAGTNGLTLTGNSILAFGGTKTLTGGLTINGGQVRIDASAWSGAGPGVVTVNNGASLFFNGVNNGLGSTTAAANLILNAGSSVLNNATQNYNVTLTGGTVTFNNPGVWSGTFVLTASTTLNSIVSGTFSGNLTDTGANVLSFTNSGSTVAILSGTNTYSGATTIQGAVRVSSAGALSPNSNFIFNGTGPGNGRFDLANGNLSINLGTGPGQLQFVGHGGFWSQSGIRSVSLNGGAGLAWGAGSFVPTGSTLTLGTLTNHTLDFQNAIDLGGQQRSIHAVFGSVTGHAVMSGVLSGTGGGIDFANFVGGGNGLIELSGANTYTGATRVGLNVNLILGHTSALGPSNLQFNGGTVLLTAASGDFTRNTGTAGSQVQWLTTGGFGALGSNRAVNLGGAGATVTWNSGGFVPAGSSLVLGSIFATATVDFQNPIDLNGATRTIRIDDGTATQDATLSGVISGTAGLALDGSGQVRLTAANTYTGTSFIGVPGAGTSSDTLQVLVNQIGNSGVAGNLGAGSTIELRAHAGGLVYTGSGESTDRAITVGQRNGAALLVFGNGTGALTLAGNITNDGTSGPTGTNFFDLHGTFTASANVISGVISESSGLLVLRVGAGAFWRLTGANTHGQTEIHGGVLEITNLQNGGVASSLGDSSSAGGNLRFMAANSTLRYAGTGASSDRLFQTNVNSRLESSGTGPIAFTNSGLLARSGGNGGYRLILGGTNTGDNIFALTLTNLVPGVAGNVNNLGISKDGPGLWALTADNNANADGYTQNTILTGGALRLDSAGAVTGGLGVTSSHGATGSVQRSSLIQIAGTPGSGAVLGLTAASGDFTRGLTTAGTSFISDNGTTGTIDDDTYVHGVRWTGSGGFAAFGGNRVVNLGGAGTAVTWGSGGFVPAGQTLVFGYQTADSTVDFQNPISFTNAARTVEVNDGSAPVDAILSGILSSTTTGGGLAKTGAGTLALTGANTYTGTTTITAGTLQIGTGGTTGTLGTGNVVNNGALTFMRSDTMTVNNAVSGAGVVNQSGTGITILTGTNTYTGITTITAGTLQIGNGGTTGTLGTAGVVNNGTLTFMRSNTMTVANTVSGAGIVTQAGTGTTILTATNTYVGGTLFNAGILQVAADANLGAATGGLTFNGGTLQTTATFSTARGATLNAAGGTILVGAGTTLTDIGTVTGAGPLTKGGSGTLILTGTNAYGGPTTITAGTLYINGNQSAATGQTSVASGGMLVGTGIIGGDVVVANGGTLSPGTSPGTLTINGNLVLNSGSVLAYEFGQANVPGGPLNDLTNVGGTLTLDGTINMTLSPGGSFDVGLYRIFNYGGTLANNGLTIGTVPPGATTLFVQTSVAGQVNLVNATNVVLNFWDGAVGPKNNGAVNGGGGTWHVAGVDDNWTDQSGAINTPYSNGTFAVFQGQAGTVTVDNSLGQVQSAGMQFAADDYVITGGPIALVETLSGTGDTTIRVGDGTSGGAGTTATLDAVLSGTTRLVKTDLGTLVLGGTNTYSGGTAIQGGTLRISSDANLGAVSGGLTFDGGTLQNTAAFTTARIVTIDGGGGTFRTDADLTVSGAIGGAGALTKTGGAALILTAANTYAGGTLIQGGTLRISSDANLGAVSGGLTFDGGALQNTATLTTARTITINLGGGTFQTDADLTVSSAIGGTGALTKTGGAVLIFIADNTYTGGTTISAGTLQLGDGGTSGSVVGDVVNNGALAFNRSDTFTFGGVISGSGAVNQIGSGTTVLTGNSTYTGGTTIASGTLQLGNGGTSGSIVGDVVNNGGLVFNRSDTFTLGGVISGSGVITQIGSGTTVLTGNSTYTGGTTIAAGTLQLGNGATSGSITGDVVNNGALAFNRSDTVTFGGVISGSGVVNQDGTGTTILTAVNPYTGGTNVNAGTLALPVGAALSRAGTVTVAPGATLGGYGSVSGTVINNGTIAVGNTLPVFAGGPTGNFTILGARTLINNGVVTIGVPGTPVGNTLTTISYVGGAGSSIRINTVLAGDASPSDRLIVDGGTATGSSALAVTNAGGGGAVTTGNGIQVVNAINGATTAAGSFTLARPAVAGPYEYLLFQGGRNGSDPQSWFLRSTIDCAQVPTDTACQVLAPPPTPGGDVLVPNFRPEVSLYTAIPSMALLYGQALLGTLHQRAGEPEQMRGRGEPQPLRAELSDLSGGETFSNGWGRILMRHGSQDGSRGGVLSGDGPKFNYDLYALQVGTDIYRNEGSDGSRDHGGAYIAFGQIAGDVRHFTGVRAGRDTLQAWSLGAYWTHFGAQGWYLDAVAQGTWCEARSRSSRNLAALKTSGFGLAASLEGGYPIALKPGWTVEPQAQLVYQRIWLDSANDGAATVKFRNVESFAGRLGARLMTTWQETGDDAAADRRKVSVWLRANLWHEFIGTSKTTFSSADGPVPFSAALGGTSVEFTFGVTAQFTRSTSFFVSAGYQAGFERNAQAYEGRAGLRITW